MDPKPIITMQATLTQEQIEEACKQYLERQGWNVLSVIGLMSHSPSGALRAEATVVKRQRKAKGTA